MIRGDGGVDYLLIWPDDYTWDAARGAVLDGDDLVVARLGEEVDLGGGTTTLSNITDVLGIRIPISCQGKGYWIVS